MLASSQATKGFAQPLTEGIQAGSMIKRNELLKSQQDFEIKKEQDLLAAMQKFLDSLNK